MARDPAAPVDYDSAPVERIDCGDAVLPLRRFGSGPPLLLVHGFPLHGYTWRRMLPALAAHNSCLVPDLAGMGDSQWTAATDFSWDGHARRLQRVLKHAGVERCSLLAQDTGGTVARVLALLEPQRYERIVLTNTEMPGHRPPWIPLYQMQLRLLPASVALFRQLLKFGWFLRSPMAFGGCFDDPREIEGDFRARFAQRYVDSASAAQGLVRYLTNLRWDVVDALRERHRELTMPVQLIWGEDDPTFPVALAREMVAQFPHGRPLIAIPRSKLLVHEERAGEVAAATLACLAA